MINLKSKVVTKDPAYVKDRRSLKTFFSIFLIFIFLFCGLFMFGCSKAEKESEYSDTSMWLSMPEDAEKDVDVFYLYPTSFSRENDTDPYLCTAEDKQMRKKASYVFEGQATAFENTCNIYAPFYRQVDASYFLSLNDEEQDTLMLEGPVPDCISAFDYYIKNLNNNRPFILAGHSQGSNVLRYILSDYMKENPEVYKRMIAAYVIGYPVTDSYMEENPHLKFAKGANDTGVIISYNTEAEDIKGTNPIMKDGALVINPINWRRDSTPAGANENLGELYAHDGLYQKIVPGYKDAKINLKRGTLICTAGNLGETTSKIFPSDVYHNYDYLFYYFNLRSNAKERIAAYFEDGYMTKEFKVEIDYKYKVDDENFHCDITMPKLNEKVMDSDSINFQLLRYNSKEELEAVRKWDHSSENFTKRYYTTSRKDGICSLNIFNEYTCDNLTSRDLQSYYYDENKGKVLTQKQYLKALGYTEKDILNIFNDRYGEKYKNRTYDFSHLIFYFDENNKLKFLTDTIDAMTVNTADFYLKVGKKLYKLQEQTSLPGLPVLESSEEYWAEVWAGSYWLTEYYDVGEVLFSYNPETKEKMAMNVRITKFAKNDASTDPAITTYRGAKIGDSYEEILALYPEMDAKEQQMLHGNSNTLSFSDDGYLYLTFIFDNNLVSEINVGIIID